MLDQKLWTFECPLFLGQFLHVSHHSKMQPVMFLVVVNNLTLLPMDNATLVHNKCKTQCTKKLEKSDNMANVLECATMHPLDA